MKHVQRTIFVDSIGEECSSDKWMIVRPRDQTKKNFFYSFENGRDALRAMKIGQVPKLGVQEFFKFCKQKQSILLMEFFERTRICSDEIGGHCNDEDVDRDADEFEGQMAITCNACGQFSLIQQCCSSCETSPYCFDLKCIMAREWQSVHVIIRREWAEFFGDTDPLLLNGILIADLPSVRNPEKYQSFRIENTLDLKDDEYAY